MGRGVRWVGVAGSVLMAGLALLNSSANGGDSDEIPPPLAPFEYLVGGWKGTGIPTANKLKGWQEVHTWAWKFTQGKPVAMTVEIKGGKTLSKGILRFDPEAKRYLLEGSDAEGKATDYSGTFDKASKTLTLDRAETPGSKDKERLKVRLNGNQIRYILVSEKKEAGVPRFVPVVESGLTKDGESLGGSASANDGPKCIVTGGAATLSVSFEGKSYPLCCTGCREEFNDNPQKYVKKASMKAEVAAKGGGKNAPAARARDDGSFDGVVTDDEMKATTKPAKDDPAPAKAKKTVEAADEKDTKTETKPAAAAAGKAASLLRQAQALEKSGNTKKALEYYRKIVADYPDDSRANTAKAKIKELDE